ncbi:MAG: HYExAFE family protein [Phycisphaeraceae bacterium]|nr:HYExAFE family protein [Phycisphaerales bacterium]MCB9841996.1 HYExAFE family protein [Phycisphaeraceae bacterium]
MAQRRHHYERAFEGFLRANRIPYISVDEARRALLPESARLTLSGDPAGVNALKSFDFVVYSPNPGQPNLLVEVKGRKVPHVPSGSGRKGRFECWVSGDDVESLPKWEQLFGPGFRACFAFIYWCDGHPPDGLFNEVFVQDDRWYAVRSVLFRDYAQHMKPRSRKWGTMHLSAADFDALSRPMLGVPHAASA